MADHPARPACALLLATMALGAAAAPAHAARRGSGEVWRSVRLCQSESCWVKNPDGWRTVSRERHGRRR